MNKIKNDIIETLRLHSLTLIIPLSFTIVLFFSEILGIQFKLDFITTLKIIWVRYYFTGNFIGIPAYKIQLGIFFICWLFTKFRD